MPPTPPEIRSILARTLEQPGGPDRQRVLDECCGTDGPLRLEVEALLRDHLTAERPPESVPPPTMSQDGSPRAEGVGTTVGPYKILESLGEGGMGSVFVAEQTGPVRRKVALKVIKPGMDTRRVIARFEAERQALALMDHPNIAKVFDAGATEAGRPFFVMELVKGRSITAYCDQARLSPRERLELLIQVCQAIQHSHQKGIIHRDIKPSNVLVALYDGRAVPKVIDFGLAKALGRQLTERTLHTQHRAIVGTLEYMSPEQAENSAIDVDTRSDIYSLGVVLYELMTGTTPLERSRLREAGEFEVVRRIREEEPPRLSSRLSTTERLARIADLRSTEPSKLTRLVRGDLEWIAMKALEKDRTRRYATASDLARDLGRYLAGEPVDARPPSAAYKLRKFARRNRVAVGVFLGFLALLTTATAVTAVLAVHALREGGKAREAADRAESLLVFFRDRVLAAPRPEGRAGGLGRNTTLRDALDAAEPRIAGDFADRPVVEASVRDTLGTTYFYLGETDQAVRQLERAFALRRQHLGPEHADTLATQGNLAEACLNAGLILDGVRHHEEASAATRRLRGPDHPDTLRSLSNLASARRRSGRNDLAVPLLEHVYNRRTVTLGPEHPDTLISTGKLGTAYLEARRTDEALPLLRRDLERCRATLGPSDPETLTAIQSVAVAYLNLGRAGEAVPLLTEVAEGRREVLGPTHPDTLIGMSNLAAALGRAGRHELATAEYAKVLDLRLANLPPGHPDTIKSMINLAAMHIQAKEWPSAEPLLLRAHGALVAEGAGATASSVKAMERVRQQLIRVYEGWGRPGEAALWRGRPEPSAPTP